MIFVRMVGRPHGGDPTDWSGGTLAAAVEMFVKLARGWWSDTFVRVVGRPHGGDPTRDVGVADCRWQSFCDLTESADESRPLHRQRSLCLLEFYHDKIHRLRRSVSSSQKISGATLIFREPYIFHTFRFDSAFRINFNSAFRIELILC